MAELKTKATKASVSKFLDGIADERRRRECKTVAALMQKATGAKPVMWGPSIVGFGDYSYSRSTGESFSWFECGFSPRKQALTLYLMGGYPKEGDAAKKIGKFSSGGSCMYVKNLDDIRLPALGKAIKDSVKRLKTHRR